MQGANFDAMAMSFAKVAEVQFPRRLVFQRPPSSSETQTDDYGFPLAGYTDLIDSNHSVPCIFAIAGRRDLILNGQQRTVTVFKVTISRFYKTLDSDGSDIWLPVDFSTDYRAHVLAKGINVERYFQVVGSGDDVGPDITFDGIENQNTV